MTIGSATLITLELISHNILNFPNKYLICDKGFLLTRIFKETFQRMQLSLQLPLSDSNLAQSSDIGDFCCESLEYVIHFHLYIHMHLMSLLNNRLSWTCCKQILVYNISELPDWKKENIFKKRCIQWVGYSHGTDCHVKF